MEAPSLAPGTVIGDDYVVERPLAEGGMGAVYLVAQKSTGTLRAMKVMHAQLVSNEKSRERFIEEAKIGARIPSEHVVQVFAAGVDPALGIPYLIMELLSGEDLEAIIARQGRVPRPNARELFLQIRHALAAAHRARIVHRDLKPENLFVARSNRRGSALTVKVLDFGIAKVLQSDLSAAKATSIAGTPLFMAPEQTSIGDAIRPATDVWALGLIAFYVLTGRHYWLAASAPEFRLTALMTEVLVTPLELASRRAEQLGVAALLPRGFDTWFSRCVARKAEERFREAGECIDALVPLLEQPEPVQRPLQPPSRASRTPLVLLALGMVVALGLAGSAWLGDARSTSDLATVPSQARVVPQPPPLPPVGSQVESQPPPGGSATDANAEAPARPSDVQSELALAPLAPTPSRPALGSQPKTGRAQARPKTDRALPRVDPPEMQPPPTAEPAAEPSAEAVIPKPSAERSMPSLLEDAVGNLPHYQRRSTPAHQSLRVAQSADPALGVASMKIFYRTITMRMPQVGVMRQTQSAFVFDIPASFISEGDVEYFIMALDADGNKVGNAGAPDRPIAVSIESNGR